METLSSIVWVIAAFSGYIFVHELGHFLAAKRVGVRVEVFSLGFGPFLVTYRRGETLYALSLIPLGGYVKMAGQNDLGPDTYTGKPYEYTAKTPFQRMQIAIAGVIMNFIGGYVAFVGAYMAGVDIIPPVAVTVEAGSPAEKAGVLPGDRVLAIDGAPVRSFQDIEALLAGRGGRRVRVTVASREGSQRFVEAVLPEGEGRPDLGIRPEIPLRIGVETVSVGVYVAGVEPKSPADEADLKEGDIIVAADGVPITDHDQFREKTRSSEGQAIALDVRRDGAPLELIVTPRRMKEGQSPRAGVLPANLLLVTSVAEDSAAQGAGLAVGDRIVAMGQRRESLRPERGARGLPRYIISVRRYRQDADGALLAADSVDVPADRSELRGTVLGMVAPSELLRLGPIDSAVMGFRKTVDFTALVLRFVVGLFKGQFKFRDLAGPVAVVSVTYEATKAGFGALLMLFGLVSVNLAVFNLFPLPPLDGGLLVFLLYEKVLGKPAPRRVQEGFLLVGIVLLLGLVVLVTRNDIFRMLKGG